MPAQQAKQYKSKQEQKITDDELFEKAKVNKKKLDTLTLQQIVKAIVDFGELIAEYKLYPYQREVAERIVWDIITNGGNTFTVEFCRQAGKSSTFALIITACAIMLPLFAQYLKGQGYSNNYFDKFERGFWVGVYAPDYERAGIIGNKINEILSTPTSLEVLTHEDVGMSFPEKLSNYLGELPRGSRIKIKSANKRVSIEGDTHHFVVTDETQEISDVVLKKSLSPMLAATNGTCAHLGSAYTQRVYFYDLIKQNKEIDTKRSAKNKLHFEVDYRVVEKNSKYYKDYISREKRKLGEFSDEFRMSYENYWMIEKGMFVTEDYLHKYLGGDYYVCNSDYTNDHVIAIDIAKSFDSTVITVMEVDWNNKIIIDSDSGIFRHKKKLKNWLEISGDDYDAQFFMICEFIDNYKWNKLVIDATGVGAHMYDRLKNKYSPKGKLVVGFIYTRPDKSYAYSILHKEIMAAQDGEARLIFPDSEKARALKKQKQFVSQMSNLVKSWEGGYMLVYHSSSTGHDDYADSLMLAVYGVEEKIDVEAEEEIEIENIYKNNTSFDKNFWR